MNAEPNAPQLHHVVFAVAPERHAEVAQFFTELGFELQDLELNDLGLHVNLDWDRGVELMAHPPRPRSGPTTRTGSLMTSRPTLRDDMECKAFADEPQVFAA
ncbi:hypothetical protein [Mycolicibacterium baixiangningiae]|uniref:hypothetical protein n=1 Tax=Mycolicibacterium baixiangningiae TaxID=2761578 RepID=UPI0018D03676|nr:hypothetical protein [Mycolicibacterium baixiangningiae]